MWSKHVNAAAHPDPCDSKAVCRGLWDDPSLHIQTRVTLKHVCRGLWGDLSLHIQTRVTLKHVCRGLWGDPSRTSRPM